MISAKLYAKFASNPSAFREALTVDVDGQPRRFGDVQDDWQRADFASIDSALMRCNGRSSADDCRMRAYLERPRGHSKTTDLAVTCCYALAFATRPIRGYGFAADKDQARLLRDAMETVCRLNPWLSEILAVQAHSVINIADKHPGNGATLSIEASDVGSSFGILPDLIIADELTHWEGDGALWHSLISSAARRSNCLLVVISNAGFCDSWQWSVRETARTDAQSWVFSRLEGPRASWLPAKRLDEQRRMLPATAFARLWLNEWSTGGGDALAEADVRAAFDDALRPMEAKQPGYLYTAGLDLGIVRDCAAFVVLAVPDARYGKIRLAHNRLWKPTLGRKIELSEIEAHVIECDRLFGLEVIGFDPWQAELMAQRLEANTSHRRRNQQRRFWAHPWMKPIQGTTNLKEQATLTCEYFTDRRLSLYPCEPLRQDLLKLRVVEKSYGLRLESPRDASGHGDTFSAFAMALQSGHEMSLRRPTVVTTIDGSNCQSSFARALADLQSARVDDEEERELFREWDANNMEHLSPDFLHALREAGRI